MELDNKFQSALISGADGVGMNKFEEYLNKPYFYTYISWWCQTTGPSADQEEANLHLVLSLDDLLREGE